MYAKIKKSLCLGGNFGALPFVFVCLSEATFVGVFFLLVRLALCEEYRRRQKMKYRISSANVKTFIMFKGVNVWPTFVPITPTTKYTGVNRIH